MNYQSKSDGLTEAIERLRSELGAIKEELRVIDLRRPALESRAKRISEALSTLMGDGSTGDPRWMQLPRVTQSGLEDSSDIAAGGAPREYSPRIHKPKAGPAKKPEISEDAVIAMAYYIQNAERPVKSSELYEHLVKAGQLEPIDTEMPYKSFAITLRNVRQELIEYSRNSKTWTCKDRSPKAKLREAMEKGDGTRVVSSHSLPSNREDHVFVKALTDIFRNNHWDGLSATRLYDELSDRREFGLIPGVGSVADFTATLTSYNDFFPFDAESNLYQSEKQDVKATEISSGVPGLYTVKQNGGVTV
jgi:hypothetical protein